jgi:hypothetical protein
VKLLKLLRFAPALALCAFAPLSAETAPASALGADSALAVAAYPLTTCVISGDKLEGGDMGAPINYVYKEAGKPDRLVRLCCKGCIKTFNKAPAKYLALIDAAAAKAAPAPSAHQVAPTP